MCWAHHVAVLTLRCAVTVVELHALQGALTGHAAETMRVEEFIHRSHCRLRPGKSFSTFTTHLWKKKRIKIFIPAVPLILLCKLLFHTRTTLFSNLFKNILGALMMFCLNKVTAYLDTKMTLMFQDQEKNYFLLHVAINYISKSGLSKWATTSACHFHTSKN